MHVEKNVRLNAGSSKIWEALSDWGGVWRFHPWVLRSPILGPVSKGVGAARRCEFEDKSSIVETITHIEEGRLIKMTLSETPKPMKGGAGSLRLTPRGQQTDVTVVMDVELGMGPLNPIMGALMMKPMMKKRIQRMLESLEFHLRTGGKIDSRGVQQTDVRPSPQAVGVK